MTFDKSLALSKPHTSRERAYRNVSSTTISTLWPMQLLNHAPPHLVHNKCRKASYMHIARDDLHRRDLFKHLGTSAAATRVSFDFNVSYSSC